MAAQRPAGISFLGVLFIFLGLFSLLWGALLLNFGAASSLAGLIFGADSLRLIGSSNAWQGTLAIASGIIDFFVAYGLLGLRRWGWLLALIAVGITIIEGLLGIVSGGVWAFLCGSVGIIIPIIIVYYLLKPEVRQAFGR